jgi:predicted nucleotide-binding protein
MSRDSLAVTQGFWTPPHVSVLCEIHALRQAQSRCEKLSQIARRAGSHLARQTRRSARSKEIGTNIFIGHGGSSAWRDLKDFIQDRLNLPWDEFNRVPVAGITNIARLSEMLDAAAIAFLVMTGEDEQADGKPHARMNVVHEAGLFQGRLGFTRAIVLIEEGCEEFSNIQGLGQIRFPKSNIKAAFEEIREVLEREGLLESSQKESE